MSARADHWRIPQPPEARARFDDDPDREGDPVPDAPPASAAYIELGDRIEGPTLVRARGNDGASEWAEVGPFNPPREESQGRAGCKGADDLIGTAALVKLAQHAKDERVRLDAAIELRRR